MHTETRCQIHIPVGDDCESWFYKKYLIVTYDRLKLQENNQIIGKI
jgi:hypothetical protein